MAEELRLGVLSRRIDAVGPSAIRRLERALTGSALMIERRAKDNLNAQSHSRGTRTNATPGGYPSKVSGDLMRSITHTPVTREGGLLVTKVGPADTAHSSYGRVSGATSGMIGRSLELGERGVRYPFLLPAWREVALLFPAATRMSFSGWNGRD